MNWTHSVLDKIFFFPAINIYRSLLEDFGDFHIKPGARRAKIPWNFSNGIWTQPRASGGYICMCFTTPSWQVTDYRVKGFFRQNEPEIRHWRPYTRFPWSWKKLGVLSIQPGSSYQLRKRTLSRGASYTQSIRAEVGRPAVVAIAVGVCTTLFIWRQWLASARNFSGDEEVSGPRISPERLLILSRDFAESQPWQKICCG